jgi:NAD(P)-dependent dehydrogenase (short-subunit alcohol dehydrogenase family)
LSELGCQVIVGARSLAKNKQLTDELAKMKGKVTAYPLDLSDKQSIENFAKEVKKELGSKPLGYLINNAGVMAIPTKQLTKQNFEMQIGVNHFGHFYLTYLLWDSLKSYGHPRIINVSSTAHKHKGKGFDIDFDDPHY